MLSSNIIFRFRGPFGVPVEIDSSLFMLFIMLVILGDSSQIVWSLTFFSMLCISIFLHEVGHAWGNVVQGVPVRRIVLHGGGGFCESKRSSSRHQQELIIAMGPIVNLVLWAVSGLLVEYAIPYEYGMISAYVAYFSHLNLMLAIFNLIPVQPLDGGKLFQLGLLRFLSPLLATKVAGAIGLILSILWIPAAIWYFYVNGWILFFLPSIALHYRMVKLRQA